MRKEQKVVLITGSSGGIGRKIAEMFLFKGWDVILHYSTSGKNISLLKTSLLKFKTKISFLKADFSKKSELLRFAGKVKDLRVDSLINNAGSCVISKYFTDLSINEIEKTFLVNAFAPMLVSSAVFMQMKERGFGRIINISSIAAKYGGSGYSMHYGCSKMAMEGVTKTLAREGASYGILVNTVRPGVIDTAFHKKFPKDMEKRKALIPLRKIGKPEDVARLVYYLGSEENNYITSEDIAVSGGE